MKKYEPKYWSGKGKYQKIYDEIYSKLVPPIGQASTKRGEFLRIVSKLYYDIFNNGGCNFSNYKQERMWLVKNSPTDARKQTMFFCKTPKQEDFKNHNYLKFLDSYVNWAIMYVEVLGAEENLKKELE